MCWDIPFDGTKEEMDAFDKEIEKFAEESKEIIEWSKKTGIELPSIHNILNYER